MKMKSIWSVFAVSLACTATSFGGGFKIPDQSTRAMGMIDAFVAGADDASAVYYNPAGLTNLTGPEAITNIYVAHGIIYYDGPTESETSDGRIYAVPNFYVASPVKGLDDWFVGLGVYSPFGLGAMWGDGSYLRYDSTLAEIELININPTVAWAVTDRLSIGAGVDYFTSRVKYRNKERMLLGNGETDIDADGDGWGYNLGLQYGITDTVKLGLTYRSQVRVNYDGELELDIPMMGTFYSGLEGEIEYPPIYSGGIMWQATPRLRMEFVAEWQEWSTRETQDFTLDGNPPIPQSSAVKWEDSWLLLLGCEYQLNEKWILRAGYGYNETPVPDETAEPTLPTGDTHAVSLGAGYQYSEKLAFDVAGIVSYGEERSVDDPDGAAMGRNDYTGDYEALSFFLSVGVRYKF